MTTIEMNDRIEQLEAELAESQKIVQPLVEAVEQIFDPELLKDPYLNPMNQYHRFAGKAWRIRKHLMEMAGINGDDWDADLD